MQQMQPRGRRSILRSCVLGASESQFSLRASGRRQNAAIDRQCRRLIHRDRRITADEHARALLAGGRVMLVVGIALLVTVVVSVLVVNTGLGSPWVRRMRVVPATPD